METLKYTRSLLYGICLLAFLFIALNINGQDVKRNFSAPEYESVINAIVADFDGTYNRQEIINHLNDPEQHPLMYLSPDANTYTVTPTIVTVAFHGGDPAEFDYAAELGTYNNILISIFSVKYFVDDIWKDLPVDERWVSTPVISDLDGLAGTITAAIDMNVDGESRIARIHTQANFSTNASPPVTDLIEKKVYIIQNPAPDDQFIYVSPDYREVLSDGSQAAEFSYYFNTSDPAPTVSIVELTNNPPAWVDVANSGVDQVAHTITIAVNVNNSDEANFETFTAKAVFQGGIEKEDEFDVLQQGNPEPYIYVYPNYSFVDAAGDDTDVFSIIRYNVANLDIIIPDADNDPEWISISDSYPNDDEVMFTVIENTDADFKEIAIQIKDHDSDEVFIVNILQGGQSVPAIFATPQISNVGQAGGLVEIQINGFNIDGWEYDIFAPGEEVWITEESGSGTGTAGTLELNVLENNDGQYREKEFTINATGVSNKSATVKIVQGSTQPFILADPEYFEIEHDATITPDFKIIRFNINDWIVGTPQYVEGATGWITGENADKTNNTLSFDVEPNLSENVNIASVNIFESGNTNNKTKVKIIQKTAYPFISVSPEFKTVTHQGTGSDFITFDVFTLNIDSWDVVDFDQTNDWITEYTKEDNSVSFKIAQNTSDTIRDTMLTVRQNVSPYKEDDLWIIQGSNAPFLMASPERQSISYVGGPTNDYDVVQFNLGGWIPDTFIPDEMIVSYEPDYTNNTIKLNVSENTSPYIRTGSFVLQGVNDNNYKAIIFVEQEAAPQPYLFAEPREQIIGYEGTDPSDVDDLEFTISPGYLPNGWLVDETTINDEIVESYEKVGNFLKFKVHKNETFQTRSNTIRLYSVDYPGSVEDFINIYQYSSDDRYIITQPREHRVVHNGENNLEFVVTVVNALPLLEDASNPAIEYLQDNNTNWIEQVTIQPGSGNNKKILRFNVLENETSETRSAKITLTSALYPDITDDVYVYQYAQDEMYLLAEPREQKVGYTGTPENDPLEFTITAVNLPQGWNVDESTIDNEIVSNYEKIGNLLRFNIHQNDDLETRSNTIRLNAINEDVDDYITIYQFSSDDRYILSAPREQEVGFEATDNLEFIVNTVNALPLLDDNNNPLIEYLQNDNMDWIEGVSIQPTNDDNKKILRLNVLENESSETRSAKITLTSALYPDITDDVYVYQYAQDEMYLLAEPREHSIGYAGTPENDPLEFTITAVNLPQGWNIDETTIDDEIVKNFEKVGNLLKFDIHQNDLLQTRSNTIRLNAINEDVEDFITIYQYSSDDRYIISAPREHNIDYDGELDLEFSVNVVNALPLLNDAGNPIIEYLQDNNTGWITNMEILDGDADDYKILQMDVLENETLETRSAKITLTSSSYPDVTDVVYIYQHPKPDPYMLAEPREQLIGYEGTDPDDVDDLEFIITPVNLPNGWLVDEQTIDDDLVESLEKIENLLQFKIYRNETLQTRSNTIRLYSVDFPDVEDFITIYQYSSDDRYIVTQPREQKVFHEGINDLEFDITIVNALPLLDDETNPIIDYLQEDNIDWIEQLSVLPGNDDDKKILRLNVLGNQSSETRSARITLTSESYPEITDAVYVYQYAQNEIYLLAEPREQKIGYTGTPQDDPLKFVITPVNLPAGWVVDDATVKQTWVSYDIQGNDLFFDVEQNDTLQTRSNTIRLYATGEDDVEDYITIYQYSSDDRYIISAPREDSVGYKAVENLEFKINVVNALPLLEDADNPVIEYLQEDNSDWITNMDILDGDSDDYKILQMDILENETFETRSAKITLTSATYPDVTDEVYVYQFSRPNAYLIAEPREQKIGYLGTEPNEVDDLLFIITPVNLPEGWTVDDETVEEEWVNWYRQNDELYFEIQPNDGFETRYNHIRLYAIGEGYEEVDDTISIYQYSSLNKYIITDPREQILSFEGEPELEFNVVAVNTSPLLDPDIDWIAGDPDWIININLEPQPEDNYYDYILGMIVTQNLTNEVRSATITLTSSIDEDIKDIVSVYQYPAFENEIIVGPREIVLSHEADNTVDFKVTQVRLGGYDWIINDNELDQSWITWPGPVPSDTTLLRLNVVENTGFTSNSQTITVYSDDNPDVFDTVRVLQYSGFDSYILASPRSHEVLFTGTEIGEPITFELTTANLGTQGWSYKFDFSPATDDWFEWESETDSSISINVFHNNSYSTRQGTVEFYDDSTGMIRDEVTITQEAPYIILKPSALDNIPPNENSNEIFVYSNISEYAITYEDFDHDSLRWFDINKAVGNENDTMILTVEENKSAYLPRSSYLKFTYVDDPAISSTFYFQQSEAPADSIGVGGYLFADGNDGEPLENYKVYFGDDSVYTDTAGYFVDSVLVGWFGSVRPEISDYFFIPSAVNYPFVSSPQDTVFIGTKIDPRFEFSYSEVTGCAGDSLTPDDDGYPKSTIEQPFGEIIYEWSADPWYVNAISDSTIKEPTFYTTGAPEDEIKFNLKVTIETSISMSYDTSFTMVIRPKPDARPIIGEPTACVNQAGTVYQVDIDADSDLIYGEKFSWELTRGTANFDSLFIDGTKNNFATIDWLVEPGDYTLSLKTLSEYGCAFPPETITVEVGPDIAPAKTEVSFKENDLLICTDNDPTAKFAWGWFIVDSSKIKHIVRYENQDWYFRIPKDSVVNINRNKYFVEITHAENNCMSRTFLNNDGPVDIDESFINNIIVYPNPTTGELRIRFENSGDIRAAEIELIELSGQVILSKNVSNIETNSLVIIKETENLQPGVYLVRVNSDKYIFTTKVIVR